MNFFKRNFSSGHLQIVRGVNIQRLLAGGWLLMCISPAWSLPPTGGEALSSVNGGLISSPGGEALSSVNGGLISSPGRDALSSANSGAISSPGRDAYSSVNSGAISSSGSSGILDPEEDTALQEAAVIPAEPYPELRHYLHKLKENNPELRALWHEHRAASQQAIRAGTLPDPEVSIGYDFNPMNSNSVTGRFSVSAMQMFPWFGTLDARKELQWASAEIPLRHLDLRRLELFREFRSVWIELLGLKLRSEIKTSNLKRLEELERQIESRYEAGRAGQIDLLRIYIEQERLKTERSHLEDRKRPLQIKLNELLQRDAEEEVLLAEHLYPRKLPGMQDERERAMLSGHPALRELEDRERMLREQERLARYSGKPDFGLGIEVMGRDFGPMSINPGMREGVFGMATIRVPLYRSAYRAEQKQVLEQQRALEYRRDQTEYRLIAMLEEAQESWRRSERNLQLLQQEWIPRMEQMVQLLLDEYSAGMARFEELNQALRELLELKQERIMVLVQQNLAAIELQSLLEFNGTLRK